MGWPQGGRFLGWKQHVLGWPSLPSESLWKWNELTTHLLNHMSLSECENTSQILTFRQTLPASSCPSAVSTVLSCCAARNVSELLDRDQHNCVPKVVAIAAAHLRLWKELAEGKLQTKEVEEQTRERERRKGEELYRS